MMKLIAIDLDGTLLNSDGNISKRNIQALHDAHQQGVKIVLCTGRPYLLMKDFVEEIGLNSTEDFIITFNGGLVQKAANGEVIKQHTLSQTDMQKWYNVTKDLALPFNIIDAEHVYEPPFYPENHPSIYFNNRKKTIAKTQDFATFSKDHQFNKFVVCCEPKYLDEQILKLPSELVSQYSVFKSQTNLLEIVAPGVTKGNTLKELADYLKIEPSEVMAIGDQENDLSMIEYAGVGVAMGNAVPQVIAKADHITADNNHDGVAEAIYQFIK